MSEHPDESVLRDWLSVFKRQKWIVLLAAIGVPLMAVAASVTQQRRYEASATVLVKDQNPTATALNLSSSAPMSPPDRYAATQAQLARVGTVAQMAVTAAHVPARTGGALLANSSVSADPTSDLLTFSATDSVPAVAVKLVNAYAAQFTVYRQRLDNAALSGALSDIRRKLNGLVASGQGGSALFRRLATTERDLAELQPLQQADSSAVLVGPASGARLVQPRPKRDVILGVIVGLALGIALAFVRHALDTRVHDADELSARLGLPLLGEIPKPDRRLVHRQQLATLSEPTASSAEGFRILKTNLEIAQLQRPMESIVITSTARGEGKSTTAANLAVILARSGRHVILVDFDLRHPSLAQLFRLGDRPGLAEVAGGVDLEDALTVVDLQSNGRTANAGRLEVLTAGRPRLDPGEFVLSSFVTEALAELASRCELLLIDTPPVLGVGDALTIAARSDALILLARLDHVRRATLAEARRALEASPTTKLGVVATGTDATYAATPLRRLRWGQWSGRPRLHLGRADRRARRRETSAVPMRDFFDAPEEGEETRGGVGGVVSLDPRQRERDD